MGAVRKTKKLAQIAWRSNQIGWTVSRYAVAEGLGTLGIEVGKKGLSVVSPRVGTKRLDKVFGKQLAKTFVRLGPTFIKLGQMMALRPDLVGDVVAEQLRVLFDRVPPVPYRQIRRILRQQLGEKLKTRFKTIDPKPLACASMAQVHQGVLTDGTPVIIKVQKPGVASTVKTDLVLLEGLAHPLSLAFPQYDVSQMFKDFRDATLQEIDFLKEAKNIKKFQRNFSHFLSGSDVKFPKHFSDLTTSRVLVLEPMRGQKVSTLKKGSTVARAAASKSLVAVLEQVFDHGFFHADPHSGNLFFIEDSGQVGFIDMGLVGQLEPEDKRKFLRVLLAVLRRDKAQLAKALYELGTPGKKTNFKKFEKDIQALLTEIKRKGLDKVRMSSLVNRLLKIARMNSISIPNRYVMMMRSFLVIEGVAKALDPKISLFQVAPPIVMRSLIKSYNPLRIFLRR